MGLRGYFCEFAERNIDGAQLGAAGRGKGDGLFCGFVEFAGRPVFEEDFIIGRLSVISAPEPPHKSQSVCAAYTGYVSITAIMGIICYVECHIC